MITRDQYLAALEVVDKYHKQMSIGSEIPTWREMFQRRRNLDLTLRDVSKCTGVSIATIHRLENGKEVMYSTVTKLNNFYLKCEV